MKFGSATNVGKALGITRMAVSGWGEDIPELRAYQIERLIVVAQKNNVAVSELRLTKTGQVTRRVPKGEEPVCIQRELLRLSTTASMTAVLDQQE